VRFPHRILRKAGFDVVRYPAGSEYGQAVGRILRHVDVVLDVGAHEGEIVGIVRSLGYTGRIVSYEASARKSARLKQQSAGDPLWTAERLALGEVEEERDLYVSQESHLTSLLPATDLGKELLKPLEAPEVERVRVARLDAVAGDFRQAFLKVDTQGFDLHVLKGAEGILHKVLAVQVELTFVPTYDGSADYIETLTWLRDCGFVPAFFRQGYRSRGTLFEADCLLRRSPR
jgi:FkbM family methyltransferase